MKFPTREEDVSERLGRSARQRESAFRREGAALAEAAEKRALTPGGSHEKD